MFNVLEMYQWLLKHRIVLEEQSCSYCKIQMTFKTVNSTSHGYVFRNPIKLGGQNIVVQVDEMKLNHNVKAHRDMESKTLLKY